MDKKMIMSLFETNHWVVTRQVDGLTHEDSLLQLPFRGNCLNWVLGHILVSRQNALKLLGIDGSWTEAEMARYKFDSAPITSADDPAILTLERLMSDIEMTQQQLMDGFEEISEQQLAEKDERERTVSERLLFLAWHEGYHVGQTEYLRQLSGKDDKII
ncbi:MAG: DinB family protein [Chloroflexota bacterium]